MVFDMNSSANTRNLAESPLITVTGELEDLVLEKFSEQLKNDLGQKSVEYKRSNERTFNVFLEANFVRLDEPQHWLSDLVLKKSHQKNRLSNLAHYSSSSTAIDRRNLSGQSFSIASTNQYPSIPYHRANALQSSLSSASSVRRNHSFNSIRKNNSFKGVSTNQSENLAGTTPHDVSPTPVPTSGKHHLIEFLCQRVAKTNGAAVLLNTFWLKACHDLESYHKNVRTNLMDWFGRLLVNIATNISIGVTGNFNLDCAIVIVLSKESLAKNENVLKPKFETPKQSAAKKSFFKSGLSFSNSSKFSLKASSNLSGSMSSNIFGGSLTSLNVNGPPSSSFSLVQLVEQIRNDLTVTYQLFHQKQFSSGNLDTKLPANANSVIHQLIDRIVIFDGNFEVINAKPFHSSTTNISAHTLGSTTNQNKGFSLSSAKDSLKMSTNSLMSPSKSSAKKSTPNGHSDSFALTPVNYNELLSKFRLLLRDSYVDTLETFEANLLKQREMQNSPDWDFFEFFLLQEELSLLYENLGLYDKALVQYDELDALFSQSILNTNAAGGVGPKWVIRRLVCDSQKDDFEDSFHDSLPNDSFVSLYSTWHGLCLCNPERTIAIRHKIVNSVRKDPVMDGCDPCETTEPDSAFESTVTTTSVASTLSSPHRSSLRKTSQSDHDSAANFMDPLGANSGGSGRLSVSSFNQRSGSCSQISLIDFRNYLFARQCHLLCMLNKPWDLAGRALPFLQSCVSEINLLEISIAPGGIACWVFCSVLEILYKCERYSDSSQLESYSYFTVGLWSYAREKLAELGRLCNLMPGSESDVKNVSDHLHRMVELTAGMGTDPHLKFGNSSDDQTWLSPQERLKEALTSSENFLKNYLEITELTMGTYKHIGYIRSARLIGKELSQLYLKLKKPQQALPFLLDLYNMFQTEKWNSLKIEASQLMAECLEALYYSAFDQPEADRLDPNSTGFNLEATVRSAFRTFLLHLVKSHSNERNSESEGKFYVKKIASILGHYCRNGILLEQIYEKLFESSNVAHPDGLFVGLEQPLLVIHNLNSDLFYDDYNSTSNISTHSSGSANQNLIQKSAKPKDNLDSKPPQQHPHKQTSRLQNYQRDHFFKVKCIDIICDSLEGASRNRLDCHGSTRKISTSSLRPDQNSFIAGSVLTMQIEIHSELTFDVSLDHLQVTMNTANSIQSGNFSHSCSSIDAIEGGESYSNVKLTAHAHMETYLTTDGQAAVKCLNTESILRFSEKNNCGSNLKFYQQLPVSLLNQRLADDQYNFRHYRFLGSKFQFNLVNPDGTRLKLRPGTNSYSLQFKTPDNFNCNDHDSGSVEQNSNQLWFRMDQVVLLLNFGDSNLPLPSAIVDDFDDISLGSPCSFRLVKCPPTIELFPKTDSNVADRSSHTSLIVGVDHLVYLRLKSGTNVLPKGLKCSFRITPQQYPESADLNMNAILFDYGLIEVTLHGTQSHNGQYIVDETNSDFVTLDRQIEPFESHDILLTLRSRYTKPQICFVNQVVIPGQICKGGSLGTNCVPLNSTILANTNSSFMLSKDFMLNASFVDSGGGGCGAKAENDAVASCQFVMHSPYSLYTKLHTLNDKKLIEICLRGSSELGNRKLEIEILTLDQTEASPVGGAITFRAFNRSNHFSKSTVELKANCEQRFIWEIVCHAPEHGSPLAPPILNKFIAELAFTCLREGESKDAAAAGRTSPRTSKVSYEVRGLSDCSTKYFVRRFIEPFVKSKNSELFRVGNSCQFRALIQANISHEAPPSSSETCESIMYEIVYDNTLWSLVSSYRSVENSDESSTDSTISSMEYNVPSKVLQLSRQQSTYEANFEVVPLVSGYIPFPKIRLSRYLTSEDGAVMPSAAAESIEEPSSKNNQKLNESLSSRLQENLSKNNWTAKFLPSTTGSSYPVQNSGGSSLQTNSTRFGKLVSFEAGQVYDFNVSSQVYVLPPQPQFNSTELDSNVITAQ